MSELLDDLAQVTIRDALRGGPRKPVLCSLIRTAGRMLAETEGHDFAADVHAGEVRRHVEARNRQGVRRGRGS